MVNNWLNIKQLGFETCSCLLCKAYGYHQQNICPACLQDLPWITQACRTCSLPLTDVTSSQHNDCGACLQKPPPFQQCHCPFYYAYPIDRLISGLKFQQRLSYGLTLGKLLASHIRQRYESSELPSAIIPVPLHKSRLRERGFNQAYEIARVCADKLAIPLITQSSARIKNTPHQLGLNAKTRRKNLRGAFQVSPFNPNLQIRSIALIDDVMTTGSTLAELSKCFQKSGITEVHVWCLARTTST